MLRTTALIVEGPVRRIAVRRVVRARLGGGEAGVGGVEVGVQLRTITLEGGARVAGGDWAEARSNVTGLRISKKWPKVKIASTLGAGGRSAAVDGRAVGISDPQGLDWFRYVDDLMGAETVGRELAVWCCVIDARDGTEYQSLGEKDRQRVPGLVRALVALMESDILDGVSVGGLVLPAVPAAAEVASMPAVPARDAEAINTTDVLRVSDDMEFRSRVYLGLARDAYRWALSFAAGGKERAEVERLLGELYEFCGKRGELEPVVRLDIQKMLNDLRELPVTGSYKGLRIGGITTP